MWLQGAAAGLLLAVLAGCGSDSDREVTAAETPSASSSPSCLAPTPVQPVPSTLADFSAEERQTFSNQETIHDYIDPVVHPYRENDGNGYAGLRVDTTNLAAQISWKGEPPADVKALTGRNPYCVRVELVDVPFSRDDIDRAYDGVIRAQNAGELPDFSGMNPSKAFDTLEVGFPSAQFAERNTEANRAKFTAAADMPVSFVVIEGTDAGVGRAPKAGAA